MESLLPLALTTMLLGACMLLSSDAAGGCRLPPKGFSESDLIGTWVATRSDATDTLIIREDGKYKQMIQIKYPAFDFQSGWQSWRLEYSNDGIPYLHMDGMHLCAYWPEMDCEQVGGGDLIWYDFCQKNWVRIPGEGVLIVLGVPKQFRQPPRGIDLNLLQKFTVGGMKYELNEP